MSSETLPMRTSTDSMRSSSTSPTVGGHRRSDSKGSFFRMSWNGQADWSLPSFSKTSGTQV
jgi:hypothetical protein